jgi:hypothetical protein
VKVKSLKEMRDKMATGDNDVLVDVPKLLGEYRLILMTQIINSICETRWLAKDFTEFTLMLLNKKPVATQMW